MICPGAMRLPGLSVATWHWFLSLGLRVGVPAGFEVAKRRQPPRPFLPYCLPGASDECAKDFFGTVNGKREMAFATEESWPRPRQRVRHILAVTNRHCGIVPAVPKVHVDVDALERESPGVRIEFEIEQDPFRTQSERLPERSVPGIANLGSTQ